MSADPRRWDAERVATVVANIRPMDWTAFRVGRLKHWRAELEHNGRALRLVVCRGPGAWRYAVQVYEGGALLATTATTTQPTPALARAFAEGLVAGWLIPIPDAERLNAPTP